MIKNNYVDKNARLPAILKNSVLNIEDFSPELKELGVKYFYGDASIIQAYKLFEFVDEENERDEADDKNLIWIRKEEWSFERAGVHYGMITNYSRFNKSGEEYMVLKVLYSPDKIKLIRVHLVENDPVVQGIIYSFGNRFNPEDLLGQYVKFYVRNKRDDNDKIYSTVHEFFFLNEEEEVPFIENVYFMIQNKVCNTEDDL